jgi:hypothetical protein
MSGALEGYSQLAGLGGGPDVPDLTQLMRAAVWYRPGSGATRPSAELVAEQAVGGSLASQFGLSQSDVLILETLEENFLLAAVADVTSGDRRILKFCYEDDIGGVERERRSRRGRALAAVGLSAELVRIDAPGAAFSRSYHLELVVPEGAYIARATLGTRPPAGGEAVRLTPDTTLHSSHPRRAHLQISTEALFGNPLAGFWMRADRTGWWSRCALISWAVFLALTLTAVRSDEIGLGWPAGESSTDAAAVVIGLGRC